MYSGSEREPDGDNVSLSKHTSSIGNYSYSLSLPGVIVSVTSRDETREGNGERR